MSPNTQSQTSLSYRQAIHMAMDKACADNSRVFILGQGVDDHKGTFGTTLGLSTKYGISRVFDTPLSEDAITGIAVGAALEGLYPIMTHIRVDFALLAMNQLINMAAKYRYMSGGKCCVPMLVRMIIGRSWGQGAQHSQSLQSFFSHVPGLKVFMPATAQDIFDMYDYAITRYSGPVISLEHRLLYDTEFLVRAPAKSSNSVPGTQLIRAGTDITVVSNSIMTIEALKAGRFVSETSGVSCEIIGVGDTSRPDAQVIIDSVKKTGRLMVADTGWAAYGFAAEICRLVLESGVSLRAPAVSIGMQPTPCPTSKALEDLFYPNLRLFVDKILSVVLGSLSHGRPLPDDGTSVEHFRKFKGPF